MIFLFLAISEFLGLELIKTKNYILNVEDIVHVAILIVIARVLLFFLKKFIIRVSLRKNLHESDVYPIYTLIKYLVWILAGMFILQALNVNVSVLLAGSAGLLVGVGLGLQDTIKNMTAGIILLMGSRLKIGDYIGTNGIEGKLVAVHLSVSEIETWQGYFIFVPNSKIISENLINWSHNKTPNRYFFSIGVAYESDLKLVKKLLQECLNNMPDIEHEEAYKPSISLDDFADSAIIFKLFFSTKEHLRQKGIASKLREQIADIFSQHHISIPFPQQDVHIYNQTTMK